MNKKCGICNMALQSGGAWIARCKDAMNNRMITCPVGPKLHICHRCSGEVAMPTRHGGELWKTPLSPNSRLKQMAMHRVGGGSAPCTLQISPYIVNREYTVSFGTEAGRVYGIPDNLFTKDRNGNEVPHFPKVWKYLKGDKLVPRYTDFTVGSGGTRMGEATSGVFSLPEGSKAVKSYGDLNHFHVGNAAHSGTGTTERVWYNLTGSTIKFSNVLDD